MIESVVSACHSIKKLLLVAIILINFTIKHQNQPIKKQIINKALLHNCYNMILVIAFKL